MRVDFSVAMPLEILWMVMDELPMASLWRLRNVSSPLRTVVIDYLQRTKKHRDGDIRWIHKQMMFCSGNEGLQFWMDFCVGGDVDLTAVKENLLYMAVEGGDASRVDMLLKSGVKMHTRVILLLAVEKSTTDVVRVLLSHGVDARMPNTELMLAAVTSKNPEILRMILEHRSGDDANDSHLLIQAVWTGDVKLVNVLLDFGRADIHAWDDRCLQTAVKWMSYAMVKTLIDRGADVKATGSLALRNAVNFSRIKVVRLLIEHGADVRNSHALRWAVDKGRTDIVGLLIAHGAAVNEFESEALRVAAERGNARLVRLFVNNGANVNARKGEALIRAVRNGHHRVVKLLLENGGDVPATMNVALSRAHKSKIIITRLLTDFGASIRRSPRNKHK